MSIIIGSCKKDNVSKNLTDAEKIQNAKTWYTEKQKYSQTTLSSSKGSAIALRFVPDWDNALIESVDGNEVITTSVETNLKKITGSDSRYYLVIVFDEGEYNVKTVSIKNLAGNIILNPKELYQTAFTGNNISPENSLIADIKVFTEGFNEDRHILYTKNGKQELAVQEAISGKSTLRNQDKTSVVIETCIYYYITTNLFDTNGNLMWTSGRQLVDVQCSYSEQTMVDHLNNDPTNTPGYVADSTDTEENIAIGEAISEQVSMTTLSETINSESGKKAREVEVQWRFYRRPETFVQFKSLENAKIETATFTNTWFVSGISHIGLAKEGLPSDNHTSDVSILNSQSTLIDYYGGGGGGTNALFEKVKMKLTFQETYTFLNVRGQRKIMLMPVDHSEHTWAATEIAKMP